MIAKSFFIISVLLSFNIHANQCESLYDKSDKDGPLKVLDRCHFTVDNKTVELVNYDNCLQFEESAPGKCAELRSCYSTQNSAGAYIHNEESVLKSSCAVDKIKLFEDDNFVALADCKDDKLVSALIIHKKSNTQKKCQLFSN